MDFIEPCFGIGHNLSLICQMTSEDIKHQLIIIIIITSTKTLIGRGEGGMEVGGGGGEREIIYLSLKCHHYQNDSCGI